MDIAVGSKVSVRQVGQSELNDYIDTHCKGSNHNSVFAAKDNNDLLIMRSRGTITAEVVEIDHTPNDAAPYYVRGDGLGRGLWLSALNVVGGTAPESANQLHNVGGF